jgi:EPS-associated MarR family transcriptional regulator
MNEIEQLHAERSLLEAVAQGEHANQRQLSRAIGLSLGKTNYVLKALIERGLIKVANFRRSRNKMGYVYLLTAEGIKEKVSVTKRFLAAKESEYLKLEYEIRLLKAEVESSEVGVKP